MVDGLHGRLLREARNSCRMSIALRRSATKDVMEKERRTWRWVSHSLLPGYLSRGTYTCASDASITVRVGRRICAVGLLEHVQPQAVELGKEEMAMLDDWPRKPT
jgi:hypothetical protein